MFVICSYGAGCLPFCFLRRLFAGMHLPIFLDIPPQLMRIKSQEGFTVPVVKGFIADRAGRYTRIVKLDKRRFGDQTDLCIL
jgi:hypothetical protein